MSPGQTMMRVYAAMRARVMAGAFAPGARIDPSRIAPSLSASVTPVRDALHRLVGERLVESWDQDGFHQPIVTEASLRDLYALAHVLLRVILADGARARIILRDDETPAADWPARAGAIARHLADCTPNLELGSLFVGIDDRLRVARHAEAKVFADPGAAFEAVMLAVAGGQWPAARRHATSHYRHRLAALDDIAGLLRPPGRSSLQS